MIADRIRALEEMVRVMRNKQQELAAELRKISSQLEDAELRLIMERHKQNIADRESNER